MRILTMTVELNNNIDYVARLLISESLFDFLINSNRLLE